MAGVLTHLTIAFLGFLIVYFVSKNWIYGLSFSFGHLIPDVIKFGIPGVELGTTSFNEIIASPLFWTLDSFTHSIYFWTVLIPALIFLGFVLMRFNRISQSNFKTFVVSNLIIYSGVVVHLIIDALVIERSYWI